MAASAEYELEKRVERLDLFPVELEKGVLACRNTDHLLLMSDTVAPMVSRLFCSHLRSSALR